MAVGVKHCGRPTPHPQHIYASLAIPGAYRLQCYGTTGSGLEATEPDPTRDGLAAPAPKAPKAADDAFAAWFRAELWEPGDDGPDDPTVAICRSAFDAGRRFERERAIRLLAEFG